MSNDLSAVQQYIERARARGLSDERIRTSLLEAGWEERILDVVFSSEDDPVPVPRPVRPVVAGGGLRLDVSSWQRISDLSGDGQHLTTPFSMQMPWRLAWTAHSGDNLAVWVCDTETGQQLELVVNEVGPGSGTAYATDSVENGYLFVDAGGPWQLGVEVRDHQPRQEAPQLDLDEWEPVAEFSAKGHHITTPFALEMPWRVMWSAEEDENIAIWVCDADTGEQLELVVNEVGPGEGAAYASNPVDDGYLLIQAAGPWSLAIEARDGTDQLLEESPELDVSQWDELGTLNAVGEQVTTAFSAPMPWRVRWTITDDECFAVWLHDYATGEQLELLVNEIGPATGVAYATCEAEEAYLLMDTTGSWRISIEVRP